MGGPEHHRAADEWIANRLPARYRAASMEELLGHCVCYAEKRPGGGSPLSIDWSNRRQHGNNNESV